MFWAGDVPLGIVRGACSRRPSQTGINVHAAIGASLSHYGIDIHGLAQFAAAEKKRPNTSHLDVSLVIPTLKRHDALERCLYAVRALHPAPAEIVVVDNSAGGDAATAEIVGGFSTFQLIRHSEPGASAARNRGVAETRSPIVAFLDDDVIPHPSWLARLADSFANPQVGVVTGLVLPARLETKAQRFFEERMSFVRGFVPRTFPPSFAARGRRGVPPLWEVGGSGNLAVRRQVFTSVGGFDPALGAGRAGCSEDTEFFDRALGAQWICHYEPRAVAFHDHRGTDAEVTQQLRQYMRGHVAALLAQWRRSGRRQDLYRVVFGLPWIYARRSVRSLCGDPRFPADVLGAEMRGCLQGVRYFLLNRHALAGSVAPPSLPP